MWLEPQNSPETRGFCPLGTPKKGSVNFFDHHCKGKVFTNIFFCRKFVSNVSGLGSIAYWMDATRFSSLREKRISQEMTSQWRNRWARPISKCVGMSYGSNDTFGDFPAHSVQTLWSLIGLPTTVVAGAGVKGFFKQNFAREANFFREQNFFAFVVRLKKFFWEQNLGWHLPRMLCVYRPAHLHSSLACCYCPRFPGKFVPRPVSWASCNNTRPTRPLWYPCFHGRDGSSLRWGRRRRGDRWWDNEVQGSILRERDDDYVAKL